MNRAKVQIIVPVYNAQEYLRKCLDSLKEQKFTDWEAIIIDDASSDSSADIIKEYQNSDGRFTYVLLDKNKGVSNARNTALAMLSGEYTAFIDSDDYWEKDMLSKMVETAQKNDADIVQCSFIYDFSGGKTFLPKGAFNRDIELSGDGLKKVYLRMMTGINMNHVCMKLIRTELIGDLRFETDLKTAEDLQFCIRLFGKVKKYCFINKAMYHYRRSNESLTGSGISGKEKLRANRRVSIDMKKALAGWGMDNFLYRRLCELRPYIITASKIVRIFREKLFTQK